MIESPKPNVGDVAASLRNFGESRDSGRGTVTASDRAAFEAVLDGSEPSGVSPAPRRKEQRSGARHDLETGSLRDTDARDARDARELKKSAENPADGFDTDNLMRLFEGTTPGLPRDLDSRLDSVAAASAGAEKLDNEALEALVSRILVSAPKEGGSEVRLYLSDRTLAGTEIILRRDNEGFLSVKCLAGDPNAFQTLVGAQSDLKARLEASEGETVSVTVENNESDEDAAEHQSRGRHDNDQDREDEFPG